MVASWVLYKRGGVRGRNAPNISKQKNIYLLLARPNFTYLFMNRMNFLLFYTCQIQKNNHPKFLLSASYIRQANDTKNEKKE